MNGPPVTADDVEAARGRIADVVHRTPLDTSRTFAEMSGAGSVGLKLEPFQRTGSFKIRGAYNAMAQLSPAEREHGVITASAGNHAQGVALAGDLLDIDVTVFVPEVTPAAKIQATRGYGAEVVVEGDIYERSYEHALERAEETGERFVHPFDDPAVVAGQGTVGLELRSQFPDLDAVVVPVGGGGLIGGIGTALKAHDPEVRVLGVQPEGAAHAKPSLERGELHRLDGVDTVADGIADLRMSETTLAVAREVVDDVVSVSDRAIAAAVALLAERSKVVAESAGAAPLAALLDETTDFADERVAVIVSGGNVDLSEHAELTRLGRLERETAAELRLAVSGWPGRLSAVVDAVESGGAELVHVERARRARADHPNRTPVTLELEGSSPDHLGSVLERLNAVDGVSVVDRSPDGASETDS